MLSISEVLSFMQAMHPRVEQRHDSLTLQDCRMYLKLLSKPSLASCLYHPIFDGVAYRFIGHQARIALPPGDVLPLPDAPQATRAADIVEGSPDSSPRELLEYEESEDEAAHACFELEH